MINIKLVFIAILSGTISMIAPALSSASDSPPSIAGEARVIAVNERYVTVIEQRPVEECRDVTVNTGSGSTSSDTPEILGLLIGGAIGKQLDDDNGDTGATIGAILGASIASDMEKKNAQRNSQGTSSTQRRCTTVHREVEVQRVDGYDVTYEYDDKLFTWTMKRRPGATIPVKIYVLPDE